MNLLRPILLRVSTSRTLAQRLPRYRFVQRAVKRFIPGERLEDALLEAGELDRSGFPTLLTWLGEHVTTPEEAEEVTGIYLGALEEIERAGLDTQLSIKLSQLGFDVDHGLCREQLSRLAAGADASGSLVWIDMESSAMTAGTIDLYLELSEEYRNLGICLQAYLRRTADDLERLLDRGRAIRLVKGAYREPAATAFPSKGEVDSSFRDLALRVLERGHEGGLLALGTHDRSLVDELFEHQRTERGPEVEVQMLYGIRDEDGRRWSAEGRQVRVLISCGDAWFPWYVRRLAERPANLWFVLRQLSGIFAP